MGRNKRKFIDKKKDVTYTFKLVPRSQRDPLAADENAPQFVLREEEKYNKPQEKIEEQRTFGIYFDDDYDYLQHLKGVHESVDWETDEVELITVRKEDPKKSKTNSKRLELPSSLFESFVEEPIGLLNKAAPVTGPRPELDPDIVAELDKADTNEGNLFSVEDKEGFPDDFVQLLNAETPLKTLDEDDERYENDYGCYRNSLKTSNNAEDSDSNTLCSDDDSYDDVSSLKGGRSFSFTSDEAKSKFTNYSLSSSHVPRTELMSQLDDRFEETYLKEYDEDQLGSLETEEIEGYIDENSDEYQQALQSYMKAKKKVEETYEDMEMKEKDFIIRWIRSAEKHKLPTNDVEEVNIPEKQTEENQWDCQSFLSTYSNIYNHPRSITDIVPHKPKQIQINPKTGMPLVNTSTKLTRRAIDLHNQNTTTDSIEVDTETLLTSVSAFSIRPKDETNEDKRIRKKAVKEMRRERRLERKANKEIFKEYFQAQSRLNQTRQHKVTVT